jgi:SNF2 family DNA or RNA helicase
MSSTSKKKSNKLSDTSSSEAASSDDSEEENDLISKNKNNNNNNKTLQHHNHQQQRNKKVKYSSEEEDKNLSDGNESDSSSSSSTSSTSSSSSSKKDSDEDYEESDSYNKKSESSSIDSEDDDEDGDDSNDSDYNFGRRSSRRSTSSKKKKSRSKSLQKKMMKKASSNNRSSPSRTKKPTTSKKTPSSSKSYEKRTTVRGKAVNYCEDDSDETEFESDYYDENDDDEIVDKKSKNIPVEDPNVETIEKVLKSRRGRVGATGSKTAIYNVEDLGDPNEQQPESDIQYEDQYLIKWQGWSHLHNTWESRESLMQQKVNGIKKMENFLKKEEDLRLTRLDQALSPEDIEYQECQKEMMDNLLENYQILERIVSTNIVKNPGAQNTIDYLCKWQGLPYSDCTWEDGELIKKRFSNQVIEYEKRQNAQTLVPLNVKSQKAIRLRPRFVALKEQPGYLGATDPDNNKLRDYQLDGLNWLANSWCKQNGVILADEMGLGKTLQTISFVSYVFNEHSLYGPFLVVIPLSTIQGWQREFQKWAPEINVVLYLGDGSSRSMVSNPLYSYYPY